MGNIGTQKKDSIGLIMGMASSQARLLTLTARMHQIEYKAAKLEAMKLQMANESRQVYEEYLNAIDTTKLEYKQLSTDGSIEYKPLTANDIYSFNLDKQYALKTLDGKMLIPASLHEAFTSSDSLGGFISDLGLPVDYTTGRTSDFYFTDEEYPRKHAEWENVEPDIDDYFDSESHQTLADAFETAGSSCYTAAVNGSVGCYAHVLAHILDYTSDTGFGNNGCNEDYYSSSANSHTTTTGRSFSLTSGDITGAGMDDHGGINDVIMSKISEVLNTGERAQKLDTDADFSATDLTTEFQKLSSMYNTDGSTKTLKQWAKDLYYLCHNYSSVPGATNNAVANTIITFQEHLTGSLGAFDFDRYRNDYNNWRAAEPSEREVEIIALQDKDQSKWYANLWNEMNNSTIGEITQRQYDYTSKTGVHNTGYGMREVEKGDVTVTTSFFNTPETEKYIVIPDEFLNDPQWLTNIVNDAFAIIETFIPRENQMIDTSVAVETEFREVPDEIAIKKAEAKYEADMKRIDLKDRRYDTDLAAIEAERNAIKQEMETLKTVTKDNVERTFKLFS